MGDHCFPWGLCCEFWCSISFFLLREGLRGWKLLHFNSLKNILSEGIGLEEKISMMLELIFHAALFSGKRGCCINCCFVHLLCWQDLPDYSPAVLPFPGWLWLASMLVSSRIWAYSSLSIFVSSYLQWHQAYGRHSLCVSDWKSTWWLYHSYSSPLRMSPPSLPRLWSKLLSVSSAWLLG